MKTWKKNQLEANLNRELEGQRRAQERLVHAKHEVVNCEHILKNYNEGVRKARERLIPRSKDESPIQYYKRTGSVDDRYTHLYKGFYYCNPAHCRSKWMNKKDRDEHLESAYGALC